MENKLFVAFIVLVVTLIAILIWGSFATPVCRTVPGSQCVSCIDGPFHTLECPTVIMTEP